MKPILVVKSSSGIQTDDSGAYKADVSCFADSWVAEDGHVNVVAVSPDITSRLKDSFYLPESSISGFLSVYIQRKFKTSLDGLNPYTVHK